MCTSACNAYVLCFVASLLEIITLRARLALDEKNERERDRVCVCVLERPCGGELNSRSTLTITHARTRVRPHTTTWLMAILLPMSRRNPNTGNNNIRNPLPGSLPPFASFGYQIIRAVFFSVLNAYLEKKMNRWADFGTARIAAKAPSEFPAAGHFPVDGSSKLPTSSSPGDVRLAAAALSWRVEKEEVSRRESRNRTNPSQSTSPSKEKIFLTNYDIRNHALGPDRSSRSSKRFSRRKRWKNEVKREREEKRR